MIEIYSNGANEYYDEKGNHLFTVINHYEEDTHYFDNGQMVYVGRDVTAHYKKMSSDQAEIEFSQMYEEFEKQREINRNIDFVHNHCKKEAELAQAIRKLPNGSYQKRAEEAYQDYLFNLSIAIKTEKAIQNLKEKIAKFKNANPWKKVIDAHRETEDAINNSRREPERIRAAKKAKFEKREADPQWQAIRTSAQFLTKHGDKKTARTLVQAYLKTHEKE